jgi:hypothetical protein
MKGPFRSLLLALLVVPVWAQASVGKVSTLQGSAERVPKSGERAALAVGSDIELGDTLEVGASGSLKLTLNEGSVLALGPGSVFEIEEAQFAGQERQAFSAKLWVGKFWAKVTKALAGSDAKFQVTTERAVAGVRGTIFRVDAVAAVDKTRQGRTPHPSVDRTVVKVVEGKVGVEAQIRKRKAPVKPQGPRHEVAGPQEISAEEWEKKFAELQANQQVVVGESSFQQGSFNAKEKDAFDRFVDKP